MVTLLNPNPSAVSDESLGSMNSVKAAIDRLAGAPAPGATFTDMVND